MMEKYPSVLLALWACFAVSEMHAFNWSEPFVGGQVVYSCVGQKAIFPWVLQLDEGETIHGTRWTVDTPHTSELIAMSDGEIFVARPKYLDRVKQVGELGIVLDSVTPSDSGNYSVEVGVLQPLGTLTMVTGTAVLQAGADIKSEGQLTLTQLRTPAKNKTTGRWSVVLSCGPFPHITQPPFPVNWTTPSGKSKLKSSYYEDRHYKLMLPNPVEGGEYKCQVPEIYSNQTCITSYEMNQVTATVTIDEDKARLSLLEAHLGELLEENRKLKSSFSNMEELLSNITEQGLLKARTPATIRLVGGSTSKKGRVEVLYDGSWGTVCDDEWGTSDARVVCRQLGYSGGTAYAEAHFGQGTGNILLDNVGCNGNEARLTDCNNRGWRVNDCSHSEDAGVSCD